MNRSRLFVSSLLLFTLVLGGCGESEVTAPKLAPGAGPLLASFFDCPELDGLTVFGCRAMTSAELSALGVLYDNMWPEVTLPTGSEVCGDFRSGGFEFLQMELFVFDSLKTADGSHAQGFVDPLAQQGGIRTSDLGTNEAGVTVLHEGGHIKYPEMGEFAIELTTQFCYANYANPA